MKVNEKSLLPSRNSWTCKAEKSTPVTTENDKFCDKCVIRYSVYPGKAMTGYKISGKTTLLEAGKVAELVKLYL